MDSLKGDGEVVPRAYANQRDMEEKQAELKLRPCHHRKADRVRAHCLLTVLAANAAQRLEAATGLDLVARRKETKSFQVVQMKEGVATTGSEPSPTPRSERRMLPWVGRICPKGGKSGAKYGKPGAWPPKPTRRRKLSNASSTLDLPNRKHTKSST